MYTKTMGKEYVIPCQAKIGHVHLKVADLNRAIEFYCTLLGFEITGRYGEVAFLSAEGYHHHISLNTWHSKGSPKASRQGVGLYHTAIVYPSKKDLAVIYSRLQVNKYPLMGFSDHGVSYAIYLDDPDGHGVELYWDKPVSEWPKRADGSVEMQNKDLDLADLLKSFRE